MKDEQLVVFTINSAPVGKMRHRSMVLPNGKIHNYNSRKNTDYEKLSYKNQCQDIFFDGEVEVSIIAFFDIPKSWSKSKKQSAVSGDIMPKIKPDCDNISKIILDSLNGLAYKDDSQVIRLYVAKCYTEGAPRVEVHLKSIKRSGL